MAMEDPSEKARRDYVEALEKERRKIEVFERELPLCLQLVTQAIESCKQQMVEETSSEEGPVLEEFIPLRPTSSSSGDDGSRRKSEERSDKKPDWLRSVQLWSQEPETKTDVVKKPIAVTAKRVGGAFHPFEKEKVGRVSAVTAATSSTTETSTGGGEDKEKKEKEMEKEKEKEGQSQSNSNRKARRSWSPELHRRFLNALDQLGGSHAATPKQIRELMRVDGLTNDEVKSHLQKYRLHNRRPTAPAVQSSSSSSPQTPQFLVVGGIWVPPPEYAAAAAAAAAAPAHGVYAPVASHPSELGPQKLQQQNRSPTGPPLSGGLCSGDDHSLGDGNVSNSETPTTSTSSQTTTASPPF